MARTCLAVGIDAFVVHVFVAGSYSSFVDKEPELLPPPIVYIFPFTVPIARAVLAVGIDAFVVQAFVAGSYSSFVER